MYTEVNGKIRKTEDVEFVDRIFELKKKGETWDVIEELSRMWIKKAPEEAEAVKIDVADQREMLTDKEYGTTAGGKDIDRRFILLFPTSLQTWIRKVYGPVELPFNRKFYQEFARRYPGFKIANKV